MDRNGVGEAVTELTDDEVFKPQKEMSDAQVFGDPMPDALQTSVPEAFLDRVRAGQALTRISQAAIKEGGVGAGQGTPTGFEDETLAHLINTGIFHDPASEKPSPVQFATEAVAVPAAKLWDTITRGINAAIHGAGGAVEQLVNEFGGSQGTANRAKNEIINGGNWAMIEGGMGRFSRPAATPAGVTDQTIGGLPRAEDFANAAKVLVPQSERVVAAAVKFNDKIYTGANHLEALEKAASEHGTDAENIHTKADDNKQSQLDSWVTSSGRFIDSKEAAKIANSPHAKLDSGDPEFTAEANLKQMWQEDGIHPAEAVHDAQRDAFLKNEITSAREDVKLDPDDQLVLEETGGKVGDLSAARTDPADIPLDVQPASPPGSLAASFTAARDSLMDVGRDVQMMLTPMATGTRDSMAIAKDFANSMRRNRWDWSRIDKDIADKFTPEQRTRMWNAADEESLSLRLEEPASAREHQGLATLEPAERAMVEELQTRSQNAWVRARDLGMVEGEGLPAYTPRMIINVASAGARDTALALDGIGGNLRTKTGNLLKRKYIESQDTQAAAQAKYGDQAMLARDIRVLPLATSQLEDAIAGRTLINSIKEYGERTGTQTVSEGAIPAGSDAKFFTLDHPSFKTWRPKFEDGKAVKDENGNTIFEQVPLYVHGDFEGPLRAVLSQKSGATYGAMMALKGKTMSLIMNSPMIHNAVEWGRAFPAAPFKVGTFKVYFEGNAAKNNVPLMHEAIDNGLVPIGHRFFNQDITSVMESPDLAPGRSLTAKTLALVPGLFDEAAGTAVKTAIDKTGDFWHNTLLWDRVGDLQMGLYKNFLDANIEKGMDRGTAAKIAAHAANRYAGSLPKEAMSDGATKLSNLMLFSRSFTMGNLGVMKDMLTGLPKDVIAQIERDAGFRAGSIDQAGELNSPVEDAVKAAKSIARRKAISVVAVDIGLYLVGNSVLQSALNVMLGSNSTDQELHGYVRRFRDYLDKGSQNPLSMLWPANIAKLSSTSENEPGLSDRIRVGQTKDGTAIYARNPVGKIGEEFVGWGTSPLDMLRKKEGTIARPLLQILSNDAGFGRKIYDPEANTPAKYAGTVWAIAKHLAGSQLPEGQITALSDLIKGEGDKTVNELQLAGPLAGVTFRKGAPGGPAVGEMYHNKSAFEFRVQQAMPDIRRQILRGDVPGAQQAMTGLGMDAAYSRWVVKTTMNPATRLGAKALGDFYRTATPEQRDRMTRIQQAPTAP